MTLDYNLISQVQIVFDNFKVRTDMLQPDNLKVNNITDKSSAWKAYGLVFDFIIITYKTSNHVIYKIIKIYIFCPLDENNALKTGLKSIKFTET